MSSRSRARAFAALAFASLVASPALARDFFESEDGEYRLSLRSALKGTLLLSVPADDPTRSDEEAGGAAFFRVRFEANAQISRFVTMVIAYEHRARGSSGGATGGVLPPTTVAPFRLEPLQWNIVDDGSLGGPSYLHQHEFDRGYVALHLPYVELTLGRQAIGLGRGVLFSAIDVFSPFTPTEIDREWRRGVDAAHLEVRIPGVDGLSADLFSAFGRIENGALVEWSLLGRLRAIVGDVDAEIVVGRRGDDNLAGAAVSATVGDAEVHGEGAIFGTDGTGVDGGFLGTRGVVAKGVVGGSYMFDVGRGLRLVAEYHYSGFGLDTVATSSALLLDPAFQLRFARGDTQILGRHAIAIGLSSDFADDLSGAVNYIQSPVDGSGIVASTFTWVQSDALSLSLNAQAGWGDTPAGVMLRSDWGATPITIVVMARVYD